MVRFIDSQNWYSPLLSSGIKAIHEKFWSIESNVRVKVRGAPPKEAPPLFYRFKVNL